MMVLVVSWSVLDGDRCKLFGAMGLVILPSAFFCGFRVFLILLRYYPADLARGFGLFVDLLLTRGLDSKKPRGDAGHM
jgi:hypothetical protein